MKRWMQQNPLLSYFLLAFGIAWMGWLPVAWLSQRQSGFALAIPVFLLSPFAFGPTIAGMLVTRVTEGRAGVGALLRRAVAWRMKLRWYLAVLLGPAAVLLAGLWLQSLVTGDPIPWGAAPALNGILPAGINPWLLLPVVALLGLLGGPLNEEIGWRGYALPELLKTWCPFTASVIIGVLWGLWHLPLFWITGMTQASMPLAGFLVGVLVNTFLYTWVYRQTGGSILAAILLHLAMNTWPAYLPADLSSWWATGISALAVLAVWLVQGRVWFTRPKPGEALTANQAG